MVLLPAVGRLCSALISITAHPAVGRPSVGRLCSALVSITALPAVGRPRLIIIQDIAAVYSPVVDSAFGRLTTPPEVTMRAEKRKVVLAGWVDHNEDRRQRR